MSLSQERGWALGSPLGRRPGTGRFISMLLPTASPTPYSPRRAPPLPQLSFEGEARLLPYVQCFVFMIKTTLSKKVAESLENRENIPALFSS